MKAICSFILRLMGWNVVGETRYIPKCVLAVAPHTSNIDLAMGLLIYTSLGRKASFLIKEDWFFFPMNIVLKAIGGIPVKRRKMREGETKASVTDQMVALFAQRDSLQLAVAPEGTRKCTTEWKRGFYYIALGANVPIVTVALNFAKKQANFKEIITPSGDVDADMKRIKLSYIDAIGRYPKNFSAE